MLNGDSSGQTEPDAHSQADCLGGEEGLHQMGSDLFVDPWAAVCHFHIQPRSGTLHSEDNPSLFCFALDNCIEGIVEQIGNDLPDLGLTAFDIRKILLQL